MSSLRRAGEESLRRDVADDPERRVGIGEFRGVLPQQRLGMLGQLDRRHAFEPLRRFLPAAIGELREPHVADPAQAAAVAALGLRAKRRQRRRLERARNGARGVVTGTPTAMGDRLTPSARRRGRPDATAAAADRGTAGTTSRTTASSRAAGRDRGRGRSSCSSLSTKRVSRMPRWRQVSDSSTSRAKPASSPRNQRAIGTAKPCFCRSMIESGRTPRIACLNRYLVVPPCSRKRAGIVAANSTSRGRAAAAAPPANAPSSSDRPWSGCRAAGSDGGRGTGSRRASRRRRRRMPSSAAVSGSCRARLLERVALEQARHLVGAEQRRRVEVAVCAVEGEMAQEPAARHAVRHQRADRAGQPSAPRRGSRSYARSRPSTTYLS